MHRLLFALLFLLSMSPANSAGQFSQEAKQESITPGDHDAYDPDALAAAIEIIESAMLYPESDVISKTSFVQSDPEDVCCKRGNRDWFTSRRACRRSGGRIVPDNACRSETDAGDNVCCKKGARDWLTSRRDCRRSGGRIVPDNACRSETDAGDNVCCKKGARDWLTTRRACRRSGGRIVPDNACRADNHAEPGPDGSDAPHDSKGETPDGEGVDRRVCCIEGNNRYRTQESQCRSHGGRITADSMCRGGALRRDDEKHPE